MYQLGLQRQLSCGITRLAPWHMGQPQGSASVMPIMCEPLHVLVLHQIHFHVTRQKMVRFSGLVPILSCASITECMSGPGASPSPENPMHDCTLKLSSSPV